MQHSGRRITIVLILAALVISGCGQQTAQPPAQVTQLPAVEIEPTSTPTAEAASEPAASSQPTLELTLAPTPEPTPEPTPDPRARLKEAKILVFEAAAGMKGIDRRVHRALVNLGLTGSNVVEVGDGVGLLMQQLQSDTDWDLMIISSEERELVTGDLWTEIHKRVRAGAGLVAEIPYLDEISIGKINPLLVECGIIYQQDWQRGSEYDPFNYIVYYYAPAHPVFHDPNELKEYLAPDLTWDGDVGDVIGLREGSQAVLLAGKYADQTAVGGLLASCFDDRVIFQTFETHDYFKPSAIALWENYITVALKARFAAEN